VNRSLPSRGRVLVVDDDLPTRTSLEAALSLDFDVASAASVAEAVLRLESAAPDVVVTDYEMPGANGMELVEVVEKHFPGVMVILLTGHAEEPELLRTEAARKVARVLGKPYDLKRLTAWIHTTVRLSRMSQATLKLKEVTGTGRGQRAGGSGN
jgi:DNA-binding NtrC family response regulator